MIQRPPAGDPAHYRRLPQPAPVQSTLPGLVDSDRDRPRFPAVQPDNHGGRTGPTVGEHRLIKGHVEIRLGGEVGEELDAHTAKKSAPPGGAQSVSY